MRLNDTDPKPASHTFQTPENPINRLALFVLLCIAYAYIVEQESDALSVLLSDAIADKRNR